MAVRQAHGPEQSRRAEKKPPPGGVECSVFGICFHSALDVRCSMLDVHLSIELDFQLIGHYSLIGHIWRSIMNKEVSLAEAKATLSKCIRESEERLVLLWKIPAMNPGVIEGSGYTVSAILGIHGLSLHLNQYPMA